MRIKIFRALSLIAASLACLGAVDALADTAAHPLAAASDRGFQRQLYRSAERLGLDGDPSLQAARLDGRGAPDSLNAVVLLCVFADSLFYSQDGPADQRQISLPFAPYAAHDSTFFDHQMRDVAAYFDAVSGGKFTFAFTIHPEFVELPRGMGWYGDNEEHGEYRAGLVEDSILGADADVDFSLYDTVVLIHAGAGEETDILGNSPEQIYSGYMGPDDFVAAVADTLLEVPYIETDDVMPGGEPARVRHVLVLPENEFQDSYMGYGGFYGSLGVYCFEVGLRLGMLSLSDATPAGVPDSQGIGNFGLMGYGLFVGAGYIPSHPCAFNKVLMGWLDPVAVDPAAGGFWNLPPVEGESGTCARVDISDREYWLLEYRLQDPDGNGIFSLPGDLNGNNIPDFYDDDGPDGWPVGYFDPAVDRREWLDGSEFDFYMSENSARAQGVKGAGSGLYIWHVDEGVIRDAFAGGERVFNSNAERKAVDLEEADGIQDLDTRVGTPFLLGGDDDAFRGEGAVRFGPDTRPSTATAGGAFTGLVLDSISPVVADSSHVPAGETAPVILYAPSMSFRCSVESVGIGDADLIAAVDLPGVDLTGMHPLAADLDVPADGTREIVLAGSGGRVFAFRADLSSLAAAPAERGLLALGTDADGEPAEWIGPPAVGDVDRDGRPEIVLAATTGLYVFNGEDGSEYADMDADTDSYGLMLPTADIVQPLLLLSRTDVPQFADIVLAMESDSGGASLMRVDVAGDGDVAMPLPEPAGSFAAPPVFWGGRLWALTVDDPGGALLQTADDVVALPAEPSGLRPLAVGDALLIPLIEGDAVLAVDPGDPRIRSWQGPALLSPPVPGVAFISEGAFNVCGVEGFPRTGWPRRPIDAVEPGPGAAAAGPAVIETAAGDPLYLFAARDGRLMLYDSRGEVPGNLSTLAGPGDAAGSPLMMDLGGDGGIDIVAAGSFPRLTGIDPDSGEPATEPSSSVMRWRIDGFAAGREIWPQWGGTPLRSAAAPEAGGGPGEGDGLLAPGGGICYPNPLGAGPLHVRAEALVDCEISVTLYNLEGEVVASPPSVTAIAGDPIEVLLSVDGAASGVYLCRLEARAGGRTEKSIRPVAIER